MPYNEKNIFLMFGFGKKEWNKERQIKKVSDY